MGIVRSGHRPLWTCKYLPFGKPGTQRLSLKQIEATPNLVRGYRDFILNWILFLISVRANLLGFVAWTTSLVQFIRFEREKGPPLGGIRSQNHQLSSHAVFWTLVFAYISPFLNGPMYFPWERPVAKAQFSGRLFCPSTSLDFWNTKMANVSGLSGIRHFCPTTTEKIAIS